MLWFAGILKYFKHKATLWNTATQPRHRRDSTGWNTASQSWKFIFGIVTHPNKLQPTFKILKSSLGLHPETAMILTI